MNSNKYYLLNKSLSVSITKNEQTPIDMELNYFKILLSMCLDLILVYTLHLVIYYLIPSALLIFAMYHLDRQ